MIYGVYSIFDSATGLFLEPSIGVSDGAAVRAFMQALANSGSIMNFKPDDFSLYQVGTFDVETGKLEPFVPPSRLIVGSGFLNGDDGDYRKEIVDSHV